LFSWILYPPSFFSIRFAIIDFIILLTNLINALNMSDNCTNKLEHLMLYLGSLKMFF
jgi:hypothetical protein